MFVAVCQLGLILPEGSSLKDKRSVVKSIRERLRHRFNISVAEVGHNDALRRAEIGFAAVSNETVYLESMVDKIINYIERDGRVEIDRIEREILKNGC